MKKIIHIDMDAFFAAVEQRDNRALRGRPVIVGGPPDSRGVVAACSYEARRFGIHSAMPSSMAYRLCPQAVFVRGRFDAYHEVSEQIQEIFHEYTDLVEPLSLDEAYLDVTENRLNIPSATWIADEIRKKIFNVTHLTASAGVSYNKFLAKVASDFNKPDGITVVTPDLADDFISRLPIGKFHGIGKATEKRMKDLGVHTGADLRRMDRHTLVRCFGKSGEWYYEIAHGRDCREVEPCHERKSVGKETTFQKDISDREAMLKILKDLARQVGGIMEEMQISGRTVTLKVKYHDFISCTRSLTIAEGITTAEDIIRHIPLLLNKTEAGDRLVRLLGVSVSGFDREIEKGCTDIQLLLPFRENLSFARMYA